MTSIRNGEEFLSGAGLDHAADCNTTGGPHTPFSAPWRETEREADKTRLYQYVRHSPQGAAFRKVVNDVFGTDTEPGDADYQLARRFFARHSDLFKITDTGTLLHIEPRIAAYTGLNLRQQYANHKTSGRRGDGDPGPETTVETGEDPEPDHAKDRVRSYLDDYLQVRSDSVRRSLLEQLATEKAGIEDRWQVFEHNWLDDEYLCLPYRTRHTDLSRASGVRSTFEAALATAGDRHSNAVVLTLTTDPKAHSGLSNALQSLSDNKARLLSWLATDYQLGYRPPNLSVLEFSQSGIPHFHVVLFGISYAVSQKQLAAKWRDLGQGTVVDIRQAKTPHDGDQWRLHDDGAGTVTLSQYLGKAIRELQEVADADADELRDRLEDGDLSLWRQALYWATERQYMTCSPSLKPTEGGGSSGTDDEPEWKFVGTARYGEIPGHVRQSAMFLKPPPG